MTREELLNRIWIDPKRCFGKPCIRGHRIWVSLILDLIASGMSHEEILAEYPKEEYWKQVIARVQTMPGYGAVQKLDMFRALVAAGVKLAPNEK